MRILFIEGGDIMRLMDCIVENPIIIFIVLGTLEFVVAPLLYFWLTRKENNDESNND